MARIRTIKPEMFGDEKLAPMCVLDRFVFVGLIAMADDAGRLVDNVKSIDGFIFPETDDTAREALGRLAATGRILRYVSASGQKLIQIANWSRHQKVDHAAKYVLPAPAEDDARVSRDVREDVATVSRSDLGPVPTTYDLRSPTYDLFPPIADAPAGKEVPSEHRDPPPKPPKTPKEPKEPKEAKPLKFPIVHREYLYGAWVRFIGGVGFGRFVKEITNVYPDRPAEEPDPPATVEELRAAVAADHAAWARPIAVYLAIRAFAKAKRDADPRFAAHWTISHFASDYRRWVELAEEQAQRRAAEAVA
jgi:hypothetical protein